MPLEKGNLLEFNQYMNSDQITCIIYADIESLIKKIDGCAKNGEYIPRRYSVPTIWAFDITENKHTLNFISWEGCMKRF